MSYIYGRHELKWRGPELRLTTGRLLATIIPDAKYPKMYRVRLPNGNLTDMANISWAKEGAVALALASLNDAPRKPLRGGPMRPNLEAAE
jgi:hypothetical protein